MGSNTRVYRRLIILAGWLVFSRVKSRPFALVAVVILAGLVGLGGQIGMRKLYNWANDRNAAAEGDPSGRIRSVAEKLPGGEAQCRPRRPRAALCRCARIQTGPCTPSAARRKASAFVLSTSARMSRPYAPGQSVMRY